MCGILGGNNAKWDYVAGIKSMQHRGPDGIRVVRNQEFVMAFARLAIIDLSERGMQPMFSEDKRVGIVYNGEIYGYQDLKDELIRLGYRFESASDTEVILNAYLAWGDAFINKIDGMFGFAIYDQRDMTVKLYRDRAGIKPLYYYYNNEEFGFASELKGILNMCKGMTFSIDNTAIYDYLNYEYIPDPKTMYHHIYKLEAAHLLVYSLNKKKILTHEPYWKLKMNSHVGYQRNRKTLVEDIRELIKQSVRQQMVADVPVGTFLSGGIDSSIVTYEGNRENPHIETFSIGFRHKQYDELKYAHILISRYALTSNQQIFKEEDFNLFVKKFSDWYDEPFADTSAFPTYLLSRMTKEKVTVALTGDGGDEIFGGYPRYIMLLERERRGIDNRAISRLFQFMNTDGILNKHATIFLDDLNCLHNTYMKPLQISDRVLRARLGIPKDYDRLWYMRKYYIKDLPPITRGQYLDFKTYLPGSVLTKVDRVSMAVSLETRVPFLNRKIIEYAFGLSQMDRCQGEALKGLLKLAYEKELGKKIVYRKKQGFCMPVEYISNRETPREKILNKAWGIKL